MTLLLRGYSRKWDKKFQRNYKKTKGRKWKNNNSKRKCSDIIFVRSQRPNSIVISRSWFNGNFLRTLDESDKSRNCIVSWTARRANKLWKCHGTHFVDWQLFRVPLLNSFSVLVDDSDLDFGTHEGHDCKLSEKSTSSHANYTNFINQFSPEHVGPPT